MKKNTKNMHQVEMLRSDGPLHRCCVLVIFVNTPAKSNPKSYATFKEKKTVA